MKRRGDGATGRWGEGETGRRGIEDRRTIRLGAKEEIDMMELNRPVAPSPSLPVARLRKESTC
jgi:hypothetical protein